MKTTLICYLRCCHEFFFHSVNFHSSRTLPLKVQRGLAHSMYHQQRSSQRKMDRSWREASICSNYSRIKLIASKLIGPEKGDNRLATEHCSGGWKIHKKVGVQCKIIYNSEAPYSTGLQNWKSWRKKSANLMQWILGSSEKLIVKERIQQLVLVKKTRPITFPLKKILICKYCQHESKSELYEEGWEGFWKSFLTSLFRGWLIRVWCCTQHDSAEMSKKNSVIIFFKFFLPLSL